MAKGKFSWVLSIISQLAWESPGRLPTAHQFVLFPPTPRNTVKVQLLFYWSMFILYKYKIKCHCTLELESVKAEGAWDTFWGSAHIEPQGSLENASRYTPSLKSFENLHWSSLSMFQHWGKAQLVKGLLCKIKVTKACNPKAAGAGREWCIPWIQLDSQPSPLDEFRTMRETLSQNKRMMMMMAVEPEARGTITQIVFWPLHTCSHTCMYPPTPPLDTNLHIYFSEHMHTALPSSPTFLTWQEISMSTSLH